MDAAITDTPPNASPSESSLPRVEAAPVPAISVPHSAAESLLLWRKPLRQVYFREWYVFHYCNDDNVRLIARCQGIFPHLRKLINLYFYVWSFTGEAEFYVIFIPTLVFLGTPYSGQAVASMLCIGQFVTGTMKDAVCCPRPPSPPLEVRGKWSTYSREYGFPSTHSCHSGIFSYFLYCELLEFFPNYPLICFVVAAFHFSNVSFSRLYLGMHWMGDLIGGWVVAIGCILVHVAFVNDLEQHLIQLDRPPWYAYLLVYAALHLAAVIHATPYDPCPCYVDSLRFAGTLVGSTYGFWATKALYGTIAVRPKPENLASLAFSWDFFVQWITCIVVIVVGKEVTSLILGRVLRVFFTFLSGAYATSVPRGARDVYLMMARCIGLLTRGNERHVAVYYPMTVGSNASFTNATAPPPNATTSNNNSNNNNNTSGNRNNSSAADSSQPQREATMQFTSQGSISDASGGVPTNNTATHNAASNAASRASPTGGGAAALPEVTAVQEPDGYLNSHQVWSLRTHEHWWLWDIHKRTLSYLITGFIITFICQVILREWFGVGRSSF